MVCSICKQEFIQTTSQCEYINKKTEMDEYFSTLVDELSNVNKYNDKTYVKLWKQIIKCEALILPPGKNPNKCIIEKCHNKICDYCFTRKTEMCIECNPPPLENTHKHHNSSQS
uniref:Uncharacterized protein n=1 Tax=viral metagenome TaxID=1070528 RepID=A0A6C0D473_9ZZZZ